MAALKTALITGGAGAIGAATARMLASDGFSVVLVDRAIDAANAVCAEIRQQHAVEAVAELADLSDLDAIPPLMRRVGERFSTLHCLVNNAGMTGASRIDEVDFDTWHDVLKINLTAPMLLTKAALPLLRAAGGASIVNVASRVYLSGTGVGYTASKSGLIGLTKTLAVQLGKDGIRVNAVAPSFLNSPFNTAQVEKNRGTAEAFLKFTPLGRLGTPQDVAGAIAFLASDRASFITGDVLHICGGAQLAPQP
jgi:NAD(P)-dependent dehydrogenase (short-subunit alcohol dehydrogenase family)